eukprot:gnl/TRDRNA2_/TRDRNA2_122192_c0_seq2.p1 gnl/TRDRNA2_/TRDRNA2_122192_c0~~gnl/TRDRNA2_/TRDRNA2_122192_c0_seq2.p1  ORF type:complete len:280 (-),score=21.79 gnl/TRDRNA2_/TRDRNA2_122192_c0_seq2:14-853(-)
MQSPHGSFIALQSLSSGACSAAAAASSSLSKAPAVHDSAIKLGLIRADWGASRVAQDMLETEHTLHQIQNELAALRMTSSTDAQSSPGDASSPVPAARRVAPSTLGVRTSSPPVRQRSAPSSPTVQELVPTASAIADDARRVGASTLGVSKQSTPLHQSGSSRQHLARPRNLRLRVSARCVVRVPCARDRRRHARRCQPLRIHKARLVRIPSFHLLAKCMKAAKESPLTLAELAPRDRRCSEAMAWPAPVAGARDSARRLPSLQPPRGPQRDRLVPRRA